MYQLIYILDITATFCTQCNIFNFSTAVTNRINSSQAGRFKTPACPAETFPQDSSYLIQSDLKKESGLSADKSKASGI